MESDNQGRKRKPRPPKTQDEKERHSKAAIRKKKSMPDIKAFLLRARHDRDFWASPLCEELRNFHRYALSHSAQFPMANSDSPLVDLQDRAPGLQVLPQLSSNFFQEISERTAPSEAEPLVRFDFSFESAGYKKEHGSVRRVRLLLLDGSNKTVLGITVSNLLHAVKIQLTRGQPIIRLKNYNTTEYNDSEDDDVPEDFKPVILIVQYEFLYDID